MSISFILKSVFKYALVAVICLFMGLLVGFPDRYVSSTFEGVTLWAVAVLPSLLPFFFLTQLLLSTNTLNGFANFMSPLNKKVFRCSGISAYVHIMSILSGYPIGAKLICDLYHSGAITEDEATRMSTFCSTSGPLFIVGSVGIAMFKSKTIGLVFLIVHILSSVFCGVIFRNYGSKRLIGGLLQNKSSGDNPLYDCIYSSVISVIIVGGFVAVFYTLSQILHDFHILAFIEKPLSLVMGKDLSVGFIQGIAECTKGCKMLSVNSSILSASLACGLISFGGFSIICQSVVFLKKAKVNIKIFLLSKVIQMLFSIIVCFLILRFTAI